MTCPWAPRWLPLLALLALGGAGCGGFLSDDVTRKVHGRTYTGAFVSEEAYAAFLIGSLAEQNHNLEAAERAYTRAADLDPKNPDPWVKLGALRCARGASDHGDQAFREAQQIDNSFAPLHRERALCLRARNQNTEARAEALRAVALDPDDPQPPLLLARLALESQDPTEALRWLESSLARSPRNPAALDFLQAHRDHPSLAPLIRRLAPSPASLSTPNGFPFTLPGSFATQASPSSPPSPSPSSASASGASPLPSSSASGPPLPPGTLSPSLPAGSLNASPLDLPSLDHALRTATIDEARILARRARLAPGELASRAAALGLRGLATEQARLILDADPSSADARIALLFVATVIDERHPSLLAPQVPSTPPSPLALLLLTDILLRRTGTDAAQAILRHSPPTPDDPLASQLRQRLTRRLSP